MDVPAAARRATARAPSVATKVAAYGGFDCSGGHPLAHGCEAHREIKLGTLARMRLSRPEFRAWLGECRGRGFAHGHELVRASSRVDNVREVDETLKAAVEVGLVVSTGCEPTAEQKFMGVGGLWWTRKSADSFAWHHSTHGYRATPLASEFLSRERW